MTSWGASSSRTTRRTSSTSCGSGWRSSIWSWPRTETRMLLFGRFAAITRGKHGQRPETFEFLGFKHVCGVDRSGRFALIRIPSTKSCRKFLARTREWLLEHRHWKRREQQQHLTVMLRGFYQYFALHHCYRRLSWIRHETQRQWKQALRRRGQRHRQSAHSWAIARYSKIQLSEKDTAKLNHILQSTKMGSWSKNVQTRKLIGSCISCSGVPS